MGSKGRRVTQGDCLLPKSPRFYAPRGCRGGEWASAQGWSPAGRGADARLQEEVRGREAARLDTGWVSGGVRACGAQAPPPGAQPMGTAGESYKGLWVPCRTQTTRQGREGHSERKVQCHSMTASEQSSPNSASFRFLWQEQGSQSGPGGGHTGEGDPHPTREPADSPGHWDPRRGLAGPWCAVGTSEGSST